MKKKKSAVLGLFAALCLVMLIGCENQVETPTEDINETEVRQTEPVIVTKVAYTPPGKGYSIILPSSSWQKTREEEGIIAFTLEGEAEVEITHRSGAAVKELYAAGKESRVLKRLAKGGFDTENVEVKDYRYDSSRPVKQCYYVLDYNGQQDNAYGIMAVFFSDEEGYQVFATAKSDEPELIETLNEVVSTFKLEKPLAVAETEAEKETQQPEFYDFYDKDGNYIKTTKDKDGNLVGEDGKMYVFGEDGVTDSDGNFHPY